MGCSDRSRGPRLPVLLRELDGGWHDRVEASDPAGERPVVGRWPGSVPTPSILPAGRAVRDTAVGASQSMRRFTTQSSNQSGLTCCTRRDRNTRPAVAATTDPSKSTEPDRQCREMKFAHFRGSQKTVKRNSVHADRRRREVVQNRPGGQRRGLRIPSIPSEAVYDWSSNSEARDR